jgi:hypothetical protein
MIAGVYNWVKSFGESIPIVNEYIQPKKINVKNKNLELSKKSYSKNQNLTLETQNRTLCIDSIKSKIEESQNLSILVKKYPELTEKIKNLISKNSPTSPVEIKEKLINDLIEEYQTKLNTRFEEELQKLNNKTFDSKTHLEYTELWNDYIVETKRLMLESTNSLLFNTVKLNNINDIDLMSTLLVSRDITKQIAKKSLNQISELLSNIPIGYEIDSDGKKINFRESLKETFKEQNIDLFLISKFGMFSGDLIKTIFYQLEKNSGKEGKELFENLSVISKFQQAIQGSLIQDTNDINSNEHTIGMINPQIVKKAFEKLTGLYDDYIKLRSVYIDYDSYLKQKNAILGSIQDIKQFIYELGVIENTELNNLKEIKNDNIFEALNLDSTEVTNKIFEAYKNVNQITNNLGVMQSEEIMGIKFDKTQLINLFNMENEQSIDHFRRIILEVTILAGIKVILSQINPENKNLDFTKVRKDRNNKELPSSLNFESIPWLKNFYYQKVSYFEDLVTKDSSTFNIAPVIKEISNIGKELLKSKLFTASDFFARYGLNKEDEELVSIIGDMTEIGRMSLNIGFVTNFLSYLNHDDKCPMSKSEIENLKLLIKYLNEKSKIYDQNGKEIFAPAGKDQKLEQLYDKVKEEIGDKNFLALNTPLVINFIKKCYGQDVKPPRKIEEDSFEANNQVLSAWLFYILVKFLPEKSTHSDSLKARMEIAKIVLDQNFQQDHKVNPSLFKKMIKQTRGLSELGSFASTRGRKGIIKALCLDLENQIKLHLEKKSSIPLKEVLQSYSELHETFEANPKSFEKLQEVQKNIFKNSELLLKPLENQLIELYEIQPGTVIEFVNKQKNQNPKYFEKFTFDLLGKIEKQLYSVKLNSEKIIKESDENQIKILSKILKDIINLGLILSNEKTKNIILEKNQFNLKFGEKQISSGIQAIKIFLNSKVSIIEDTQISPETEAFHNQYENIRELRILLRRLGMENTVRLNKNDIKENGLMLQAV